MKRRVVPNCVILVITDTANINGTGPARACIQRRHQRQAAALALYGVAARRWHKSATAAPPAPATANMLSTADLYVSKTPLQLIDSLNADAARTAPCAMAACIWPFRSVKDAENMRRQWHAHQGTAATMAAIGSVLARRARRRYAIDLGLIYGDIEPARPT